LPRLAPILRGDFGRKIGRNARWLDIGCGGGALLADLRAIGFGNLTGADPYMVKEREEPGFRLLKSDGVSLNERFDVVMMNHALEHVSDPGAVLRDIHSILAPGGVVLIRIPISASYQWRHYGGEWINLDAPRHMTLFSRMGFEAAAARAGWSVRRVTYDAGPRTLYASEARIRGYCERTSNVRDLFSRRELADWSRKSRALRRTGESDEAAFYLTAP
jgi:SAM-dependent methyltransferase